MALQGLIEGREVFGAQRCCRDNAGSGRFEAGLHLVDFLDIRERHLTHANAMARHDLQQVFLLQTHECFPHGRAAHTEQTDEVAFQQLHAGTKLIAENFGA
ncbi:hypothetical protein GGD41_002965 [Paraburkholderia bryophila]|uniref:Uncharacterized protein n=1 Tax=Paraburkholderia bryophila TaxID=420952 RepID=A0A7Y9W829_9BURK|nr:hypothetical protein [Paraburkholderia bryophila]